MEADGFYEPSLDAKDWNGKDMFGITQAEYDALLPNGSRRIS